MYVCIGDEFDDKFPRNLPVTVLVLEVRRVNGIPENNPRLVFQAGVMRRDHVEFVPNLPDNYTSMVFLDDPRFRRQR